MHDARFFVLFVPPFNFIFSAGGAYGLLRLAGYVARRRVGFGARVDVALLALSFLLTLGLLVLGPRPVACFGTFLFAPAGLLSMLAFLPSLPTIASRVGRGAPFAGALLSFVSLVGLYSSIMPREFDPTQCP